MTVSRALVFSLGLSLLALGIKKDLQNIYDKSSMTFKEEILSDYLKKFSEEFKDCRLLHTILQCMLRISPQERPDFALLQKALPDKETIDDFLKYCQLK